MLFLKIYAIFIFLPFRCGFEYVVNYFFLLKEFSMISELVLNERMPEMEQIVWIATLFTIGWFFWSVYRRNKKRE
jgi:hypothetical protein